MSAWLVSKTHIDVLVTAAVAFGIVPESGANALGKELWRENAKSLRARYEDADEHWTGMDKAADRYAFRAAHVPLAALIKAIHCYQYQSCEHDAWTSSDAFRTASTIETAARNRLPNQGQDIEETPGYRDAPWGVERKHVRQVPLA